ncbi:MAG: glycosyltransferase family 39 protein [Bacteroidota bacterium]
MPSIITKHRLEWSYLLVLLVLCGLSTSTLPLMKDEGIRMLATLEMYHYQDWFAPTLYGELYFNKLPFFNWILLLGSALGGINIVSFRIISIMLFFLFGWVVYRMARMRLDIPHALLAGILCLSMARIQFWSISQCIVDSLYATLTFVQIFSLLHFLDKGETKQAFWWSYLAMALGFLTKGLPSVVFQIVTLVICLLFFPRKRLLNPQHLLAILGSTAVVGLYFLIYATQHPEAVQDLFYTQFAQVDEKVTKTGGWNYLLNFVENVGQLFVDGLPGLLLLLTFIRKGKIRAFLKSPFLLAATLIFLLIAALFLQSFHFRTRYIYGIYPLLMIALLILSKDWLKPIHYRPFLGLLLIGKFVYVFVIMPNQAVQAQKSVNSAAIAQSIHETATDKKVAFLYELPPREKGLFYFTKTATQLALNYDRYLVAKQNISDDYVYLVEQETWETMETEQMRLKVVQTYTFDHGFVLHLLE